MRKRQETFLVMLKGPCIHNGKKGMPLSTLGYVKEVPFVKARYTKGVNFLSKIVFKTVGG